MSEQVASSGAAAPSGWAVALAFNQIALESFGGGLSAWSREVIVQERGWMTDDEFLSASTICRIMPGANQVNMAVFVGMKLRGVVGALAAVGGLVAVPGAIVLLVGAFYLDVKDLPGVQHILSGMAAAAAGLTISVALRQGRTVLVSAVPLVLAGATLLLSAALRWPLWLILLLLGPAGFWWGWRRARAA